MERITVGQKGCSVEKVILTIMATPPEISLDNIKEIMRSLDTPPEKNHKITQNIAAGNFTKYDALQDVLYEWVARKSINATMEVLIFGLKKCYLNSYADALNLRFSSILSENSRKNSVSSESTPDDLSSFDYDCQSTVNSDQPFFHPLNTENAQSCQQAQKVQSQRYILLCISIILLALTATLVIMMLQNFGLFPKNKLSESIYLHDYNLSIPILAETTETTAFVITDFSRQGRICPISNVKINISVKTYVEFEHLTSNLSSCDSISLLVDLSVKEAWPQKPNITFSSQIIEISLSGPFGIRDIIEILKSVPAVNVLRLNNSQNLLCSENKHHNSLLENIRDCDANLYNLKHLHLTNFVDCEYVLDMILTCVKPKMSVFQFNGQISDANAQQLFHIMQSSHSTLTDIIITGEYATNLVILPVLNPMYSLRTLSIIVDPKNNQNEYTTLLGEYFCKVFTSIDTFVLKGQKTTYQQLSYIQNCKGLTELVISFAIDLRGTNNIELLNFSEWFPLLSTLDVELNFQHCPDLNKLDIFFRKLRLIKRVRVCSNCELSKNRKRNMLNNTQKVCLRMSS